MPQHINDTEAALADAIKKYPANVVAAMLIADSIHALCNKLDNIAYGTVNYPGTIEAISMALDGGRDTDGRIGVGPALGQIADALEGLRESATEIHEVLSTAAITAATR